MRKNSAAMQRVYIPKLTETLKELDRPGAELFEARMQKFHPRLILNMIDDPKDADRAIKIRHSCRQFLGLDIEHLGVVYRDTMQDKALASRLPVIIYKPQSVIAQAIYRIAEKIKQEESLSFDPAYDMTQVSDQSFDLAVEEASDDFAAKMAYVEELTGSGALTTGELVELLRQQQYELTQLRKENNLLKKKLVDAAKKGFKV